MRIVLRSLLALIVPGGALLAQAPRVAFPALSPACTLKQRVGLTDVEIVYSRPGVKGRVVFGGIVPYGDVWRTGANASTKISFSTDVTLEGHAIPAGRYALYTIPGREAWTVILDKDTSLWGAFNYDPKHDLVRFPVTPVALPQPVETFTIGINDLRDESAVINLDWARTRVPLRLQVDVVAKVLPEIQAALASGAKLSAGFYLQAATFYYDHHQDPQKALDLVNAMLAQPTRIAYEGLHLKAEILARMGDRAGAIAAAKESMEQAIKAEGPGTSFVRMNQDIIDRMRQ